MTTPNGTPPPAPSGQRFGPITHPIDLGEGVQAAIQIFWILTPSPQGPQLTVMPTSFHIEGAITPDVMAAIPTGPAFASMMQELTQTIANYVSEQLTQEARAAASKLTVARPGDEHRAAHQFRPFDPGKDGPRMPPL